jgi:hypothetical protein
MNNPHFFGVLRLAAAFEFGGLARRIAGLVECPGPHDLRRQAGENLKAAPRRRTPKLITGICLLLIALASPSQAFTYSNDFSVDPDWIGPYVTNDVLHYEMEPGGWGRIRILIPGLWITNGTISCRSRAVGPFLFTGNGVIGVLIKFLGQGGQQEIYLRCGAYNNITLEPLGYAGSTFNLVSNQWYDLDVGVAGDQISVAIDDVAISGSPFTISALTGQAARVGFYTETSTEWDDLVVTGAIDYPDVMPMTITGTSDLSLDFSSYRSDLAHTNEAFLVHGVLHMYLRNNGTGPATLKQLLFNGLDADDRIAEGMLAYYKMRPLWIKPGEVGDLMIRMNAFSKAQALPRMDDPNFESTASVTFIPETGDPVKLATSMGSRPEPLQINFMGFSADLQTIYVYAQNNRKIYDDENLTYTLNRIEVNGQDVTSISTLGSPTVVDQVVPIVIQLDTPLHNGDWTVVTLHTAEGLSCGHTLRAIESEFVIDVPFFVVGRITSETEAAEDIYEHCATASTWIDPYIAGSFGLDNMIFSGPGSIGPGTYTFASPTGAPTIVGNWFDELDKFPLTVTVDDVEQLESWFARDPLTYGPLIPNVIRPRSVSGKGYNEMGDGIMHSYGLNTSPSHLYPIMDNFRLGEYRAARRMFWPYYRDSELGVLVDTNTMMTTVPSAVTPRVMTPDENSIMMYGNLMTGAKGVAYWGYASEYDPNGALYGDDPSLRIGLGGPNWPTNTNVHGFEVATNYLTEIKIAWDGLGYINADFQVIGPWVARSDVSEIARIDSVTPALATNGHPAAEASTLVSGLDTLIFIVLNLNINATQAGGVLSYDPVNVTAATKLPPWLQGQTLDVFSVDSLAATSIVTEAYSTVGDEIQFTFPALEKKKIIVVTSDLSARAAMTSTMAQMKARLALITPLP